MGVGKGGGRALSLVAGARVVALALAAAGAGCLAGDRGLAGASPDAAAPEDSGRAAPGDSGRAAPGGGGRVPPGGGVLPLPLPAARPLLPFPIDARALGGDDAGLYWIDSSNQLWALPTGAAAPRRLGADAGAPAPPCTRSFPPVAARGALFWMGAGGGTLHRTRRDGAADELLATGLAGPGNPAVDGDRVYWSEVRGGPGGGAGAIASLPLEAAPGTAPDRLVSLGLYDEVTSLAPAGGNLYWTFAAVGASRYLSSLSLAPVSALLGGQTTDRLYTDRRPYGLAPIGDTVALGSYLSSGTSAVAWLAPPDGPLRPVAVLPLESTVVGLAAVDELLLASAGPGPACGVAPSYGLYVIPRAGGARALAADGLAAPAAVGPWGAAYVDQGHTLLLLSVAALRRALDQGGGP